MAIKALVVLTALPTENEQTGVSPRVAGAGTATSRIFGEFSRFERAVFMLNITGMTGTGPTLDVVVEGFDSVANIWRPVVTFPQQNSVNTPAAVAVDPLYYEIHRARWTVGGTAAPTFTFSLAAQLVTEEGIPK